MRRPVPAAGNWERMQTFLTKVLLGALVVPLAAAVIEIRHRRTADLVLIRLDGDTLEEVDLSSATLRGAALAGMCCRGTNFAGANLDHADLSSADLSGACLRGASLWNADLSGADLRGADLSDAILLEADFSRVRHDHHTRWPLGFQPE